MPPFGKRNAEVWPLLLWVAVLVFPADAMAAAGVDGVTAVSAKVSSDYIRGKLSDGSFSPRRMRSGPGAIGAAISRTRRSTI
jgi:hypothetical protein